VQPINGVLGSAGILSTLTLKAARRFVAAGAIVTGALFVYGLFVDTNGETLSLTNSTPQRWDVLALGPDTKLLCVATDTALVLALLAGCAYRQRMSSSR
jgi:hypothetical protein